MLKKLIEKVKQNKNKILIGVSFLAAGYLFYRSMNDDSSIKLSSFLEALHSNQLEEIVVRGNTIYFRSALSDWFHTSAAGLSKENLLSQIRNTKIDFAFEEENPLPALLVTVTVATFSTYVFYKLMFKQPQQYSKKASLFPKIQKFQHFYGGERVKIVLREVIEKIKNPQKYEKMKLRTRRGILLHGPPGTGKTMIARIVAGQAQLPFISASASQFQEIFVGVGPKKIRQLFNEARTHKQGCIIFIDELDAIGSRTQNWQTKEQRSTINQLLTEIDGFDQNQNILVIGATNNISLVDKALLRPGRFDLKIQIPSPNEQERKGIFETIMMRKQVPNLIGEQESIKIAKSTQGWSGAELENLINEAGYRALREKKDKLDFQDLDHALRQLYKRQE